MKQIEAQIGLLRIIACYWKYLRTRAIGFLSVIALSTIIYIFIVQIKTSSPILQVFMGLFLATITGYSLFVIFRQIMLNDSQTTIKKRLLIIVGTVLLFALLNLIVVYFATYIPQKMGFYTNIITIIIDIIFAIIVYKITIAKDEDTAFYLDTEFLAKFGLFYFVVRILFVIASGMLISTFISLENRIKYIPMIGHVLRLSILPIICVYFEEKKKAQKELGNNST